MDLHQPELLFSFFIHKLPAYILSSVGRHWGKTWLSVHSHFVPLRNFWERADWLQLFTAEKFLHYHTGKDQHLTYSLKGIAIALTQKRWSNLTWKLSRRIQSEPDESTWLFKDRDRCDLFPFPIVGWQTSWSVSDQVLWGLKARTLGSIL